MTVNRNIPCIILTHIFYGCALHMCIFVILTTLLRARLVDYLFPMSKVLKIRVGRSGKKKKGKKKKRQKYL